MTVYDGDGDPFAYDANADCLGTDTPAPDVSSTGTGTPRGRKGRPRSTPTAAPGWPTSGFYGGLYPFGDGDLDGGEPHGWFTPLNEVVALCNNDGGCI